MAKILVATEKPFAAVAVKGMYILRRTGIPGREG